MTWVFLDTVTANNDAFWYFSDVFPSSAQVVKFVQTLVIKGTVINPENAVIRALLSVSQNLNGIDEFLENKLIYPSNNPIIYSIPIHPFSLPRIAIKLLGNRYQKYNPLWTFQIYYWEGETSGVSGSGSFPPNNNNGIGGGGGNPNLV